MRYMGLNEIREKFLAFFEEKEHLRAPSFSILPENDSSLLFINSGMAPLKPYFSGEAIPPKTRMTTCQKCIRTPDIENVGKTSRHGTFFEMLGNFSFGDYFKREAASWAWEFVTKVMEIPEHSVYVSVYHEDDEAYNIWTQEVRLSPDSMVKLGKKDNFWEIGSGPCGPCSEIYFDRGEKYGCGSPDCAPGCDCERYVEFWNLVFTQFNNDGAGNYTPLKQKNIDTGMGLERLACIMQGVDNLFEVDTIKKILQTAAEIAGKSYKVNEKDDISLRVITDHIRSVTMMVADGALPSNEGRGYVLRRLLRRAARHGRLLGIQQTFLHELCLTVIEESGQAYPELVARKDHIRRVIRVEEERFDKTIDAGMRLLQENIDNLSGAFAFKLYDTYGFPVELTEEILAERNVSLDRAEFDTLMAAQRKRARESRAALGDTGWESLELDIDKSEKTNFVGYQMIDCRPDVLFASDALIVLNKTPFYAEMGGQVADIGVIENENGRFVVNSVKKTKDGQFLHTGAFENGEILAGESVHAAVDKERRHAIERAHSATHLLHRALRNVLGEHVEQAGSLVEPDKLRFDFTHFSAMTQDELNRLEIAVKDAIFTSLPIETEEMSIVEAKKIGATALFGEKYGDTVRVVNIGDCFSLELCGGTHAKNTSQIFAFKLNGGDSSVAAGVRRLEAFTGREVFNYYETTLFASRNEISSLNGEIKELNRNLSHIKSKYASKEAENAVLSVGKFEFSGIITDWELDVLRVAGDRLRDKSDMSVSVLASVIDGKISLAATCGKGAVSAGVKAGELIKRISSVTGGKGGGKPDSATGGGGDPGKLESAFSELRKFLENI